jgi:hypothetical protein
MPTVEVKMETEPNDKYENDVAKEDDSRGEHLDIGPDDAKEGTPDDSLDFEHCKKHGWVKSPHVCS